MGLGFWSNKSSDSGMGVFGSRIQGLGCISRDKGKHSRQ